ncbi:MAG: condensation domain protein [Acidobacteriaceae bacterium]|nr:condensation domain protein [Acidobacteriaceae bacterium]
MTVVTEATGKFAESGAHELLKEGPRGEEYLRSLGSLERWFWLMGKNRSNHHAIAAEIHGVISRPQWKHAAEQVQRRHPLLNASIVLDGQGRAQFTRVSSSDVPLTFRPWSTEDQWKAVMSQELSEPFDTTKAPLVRVTVLEGDSRCVLILTCHHAIVDGIGSLFLLRDLLRSLDLKSSFEPLQVPLSENELLDMLRLKPSPSEQGAAPIPTSYRSKNNTRAHIESAELTAAETSALRDRSRQEGTTLHCAITTALALAGRMTFPAWRSSVVRVFSPINVRAILGLTDECVIAVGAGLSGFLPSSGDSFWELARSTRAQIVPFTTPEGLNRIVKSFEGLAPENASTEFVADMSSNYAGCDLVVSNLQVLPFEIQVGELRVHRVWGPAVTFGFEAEQDIGVVTTGGTLTLLYTSYSALPDLLQNAMKILRSNLALS